ncbi:Uncharacterised protein [uncultured archaeon]|nr:Uncharacterised protein [uncultured archaeon]
MIIDTCILSSLAKIDRLDLLDILFKKHICYITSSVLNELNANKIAGFKFVEKIEQMVRFIDAKNKICVLSPALEEITENLKQKDYYLFSEDDLMGLFAFFPNN